MEKIGKHIYEYYEEINQGIKRYIPHNKKVLDVGGGFGALGEVFEKKGNRVCNLDSSSFAIEESKKRVSESFVVDITNAKEVSEKISGRKFDVIVFADVLEHVYDPFSVLKIYGNFLSDDGKVIISVPNVATWLMRFKLFFGYFNYGDTGTLDRTHIRFFTKRSISKLAKKAGYKIEKIDITPNFVRPFVPLVKKMLKKEAGEHDPKAIINSKPYKFYLKNIYPAERLIAKIWPSLFAFQFILIIKKNKNGTR